jgi:hypothetical protein
MSGEVMRRTLGLIVFLLAAIAANADEITLTPVVTGLNQPTTIANAGDLRLFITLQPGRIVVLQGGAKSIDPTPFLDISSFVTCCNERGLLGLA